MIRTNNTAVIGVNVTTSLDFTTRVFDSNTPHKFMMVIAAEKGPLNRRVAITSFSEFKQVYGNHIDGAYGFHAARIIFDGWGSYTNNSARPLGYFVRVDGPATHKASHALLDDLGGDAGTIEATSEGQWGNRIQYKIEAGTKTSSVANPGAGPNITVSDSGGSITPATYDVAYCWNSNNGDTLVFQTTSVVVGTGDAHKLVVTAPEALPYGADKIKVFIKVSSAWRLAGTSTSNSNSIEISTIPTGGTSQAPASNTCTIPTRKITIYYNSVYAFDEPALEWNTNAISKFNTSQPFIKLSIGTSTAPVPQNFPAVMTSYLYLQGGISDTSNITDAVVVGTIADTGARTGLQVFRDDSLGNAIMAAPGFTGDLTQQELADIAEDYYRLAVGDRLYTDGIDDVQTWSTGGTINSTAYQVFYPSWRAVANVDHINGRGPERLWVPVSIDAIGGRCMAAINIGPFRSHAGKQWRLPFCPPDDGSGIGGLVKDQYGNDILDATKATELSDTYNISTVRNIPGNGPTLFDNMLKTDSAIIRFVQERLVLNYIYHMCVHSFDDVIFQNLDAISYREVLNTCQMIAQNIMQVVGHQGGIAGVSNGFLSDDISTGFRIVIDESNNPLTNLQQGILTLDIHYRNVPAVRKFIVRVHPRNLTDGL